jgi:hypothetical protein
MRIIVATIAGSIAVVAVPAQASADLNIENWRPLAAALRLDLGDQVCGADRHQTLRRDWWWGPCVPNR